MDCTTITITSIRKAPVQRAFSLVEFLVAVAISGVFFAVVAAALSYNARSCAAIANYVDLDKQSRNALDLITKEIRQANRLTSYSATNLTFEMIDSSTGATNSLAYVYNAGARTVSRQFGGHNTVLLQDISPNSLSFSIFQRNPVGGAVDQYATTNASLCKVVQLSWVCSRGLRGDVRNTESVQSAKVVLRKE
jgi:prepilin-type N-terminal cleavage/methylation domain-containing protein